MLRNFFPVAVLALIFMSVSHAKAASVSGAMSITVNPPALALILNPSSLTLACNVPSGTLVSNASVTGGDGNAVAFTMSGNTTDFAINSSTGAVTVVSGGVVLADCNKTYSNIITATQP
jgi:hypothetical protein